VAICNCLYGAQLLFSEDMGAGFARAINDWIAREWLDREKRLRASIVIPTQNAELAVDEIERVAADRRFVQILTPVMLDAPLGKRQYWPIYAAAQKHGLPVGIHAGSTYRHPVTPVGWPSYYTEDYAAQAPAFQAALSSLVAEGVFTKFPGLKVVLIESGVSWLPAHLWRLTKFWRGLRLEVPWVDRSPTEIVRDHVRLTIQPFDAPEDPVLIERLLEHFGSDEMLLFSTDYPHWHFDGDAALPPGLPAVLVRRIMSDNARATYPRLQETVP
jgi:predicted TIM-barrel fold metal-dependent hydrolase